MPTASNPMPPPSPYTGGCTNPVSNKKTKATPISNIAIPTAVAFGVLATSFLPKKGTLTGTSPTANQPSQTKKTPKPKLLTNQKKPKKTIITVILSILSLPFISISTYFSFTAFGTENLNITKDFLNEISKNWLIILAMIAAITVVHISLLALSHICIPVNKCSSTEEKNNPPEESTPPENKTLLSVFSKHLKILFSLSTILAVIAFASVLRSNLAPADGDVGMAIQITSLQFSEDKLKWIAQLSIFTILLYLAAIPTILTWRAKEYIESNNSYPIIRSIDTSNPISLCKALIYLSILSTLIVNVCNSILILPTMKNSVGIFLLLIPFMSLLFCSLPITLTINKNFLLPPSQNRSQKNNKFDAFLYAIIGLVTLFPLVYIAPKIFLEYLPYNLGRSIASPGETLGSSGIVYDCVFSNDPNSRESTAFGVIAASKPESIHIFTPAYDHASSSYGKRTDEGGIDLNKLTETQIKISGGYRIEKFDNDKHEYDLISGKCIYKDSPFYLHTYSWNTPNIN